LKILCLIILKEKQLNISWKLDRMYSCFFEIICIFYIVQIHFWFSSCIS
jgi:hypothetical protein